MDLTITPALLQGPITPPPSKSQAHRLLLAAALAPGVSTISHLALSQDIEATLRCMAALGAEAAWSGEGTLRVRGLTPAGVPATGLPRFDCGESGSTLRFLIPIALAAASGGIFTGRGRLMERPQKPYFDLFDRLGIFYEQAGGTLTIRGRLTPGDYQLPGDVSSQFFTGLLYALPLLEGDSRIISTTPLESEGYIRMTLEALAAFGVQIQQEERIFLIPGGQQFIPRAAAVEADWSQAGFWYAAKALGSQLDISGLSPASAQGDRVIAEHYPHLLQPGDAVIDLAQCPDLAPPLAAMAAVRRGTTHLINAGRLRIKESDRLHTIAATLSALGAAAAEEGDKLIIRGQDSLPGGVSVDCCSDHRIAMMAAIAATRCQEPVTLRGAECVKKSYPHFWEDYQKLGGIIHEYTGK